LSLAQVPRHRHGTAAGLIRNVDMQELLLALGDVLRRADI